METITYKGLKLKKGNAVFIKGSSAIGKVEYLNSTNALTISLKGINEDFFLLYNFIDIERTKNYRLKQKIKNIRNYENWRS